MNLIEERAEQLRRDAVVAQVGAQSLTDEAAVLVSICTGVTDSSFDRGVMCVIRIVQGHAALASRRARAAYDRYLYARSFADEVSRVAA